MTEIIQEILFLIAIIIEISLILHLIVLSVYSTILNRSVYTKLQYQLRERLQDKLAMRSKSEARDKILKIQNGNCLPCNFIGLQSNREDWKAYIE